MLRDAQVVTDPVADRHTREGEGWLTQRPGDYAGNHEPLISKRLFDDVQDMLAGRFNGRTKVHDFLFRRYITCKGCEYSLIGELQKGRVYYRCHTKNCPMKGMREEEVTSVVERRLRELEFTDAERDYLATRIQTLKTNWFREKEKQLGDLNVTLQHVSERLNRLTDAYLDGTIEKEIYEERKAALLFERRGIESRLNDLKTGKTSIPEEVQKFLELAGSAYSLYKTPNTEKNAVCSKRSPRIASQTKETLILLTQFHSARSHSAKKISMVDHLRSYIELWTHCSNSSSPISRKSPHSI